MRTETIEIYTFEELDDAAKEKAISNYRASRHEYAWPEEWMDSLKAFAETIGVKLTDWSIGPYSHSYITWEFYNYDTPPNEAEMMPGENMTGLRLRTWLINNWLPEFSSPKTYWITGGRRGAIGPGAKKRHSKIFVEYDQCSLTGYCGDYTLVNTILEHIKDWDRGYTLRDIVKECMEEFISDYNSDMEHQDSDEYITEELIANEVEFTKDGEVY